MSQLPIEQDNKLREEARINVVDQMKKRAPKTITENILTHLIVWYVNKDEETGFGSSGHLLDQLLRSGWIRFKDLGFKRRDLERFHSHGQITDRMMEELEQIPCKHRKMVHLYENRRYWLERREYERLRGPYVPMEIP